MINEIEKLEGAYYFREDSDRFVIDSDEKAQWAVEKIRDEKIEKERIQKLIDSKIKQLEEKKQKVEETFENQTSWLKSMLYQYMLTVKTKSTKTQCKYKLLDAELIIKKATKTIKKPDEETLAKLLNNTEFEETFEVKKYDWANFKKQLKIEDDKVVNEKTGEILEINLSETDEKFEVKINE